MSLVKVKINEVVAKASNIIRNIDVKRNKIYNTEVDKILKQNQNRWFEKYRKPVTREMVIKYVDEDIWMDKPWKYIYDEQRRRCLLIIKLCNAAADSEDSIYLSTDDQEYLR